MQSTILFPLGNRCFTIAASVLCLSSDGALDFCLESTWFESGTGHTLKLYVGLPSPSHSFLNHCRFIIHQSAYLLDAMQDSRCGGRRETAAHEGGHQQVPTGPHMG
jgi:hypothetical protein